MAPSPGVQAKPSLMPALHLFVVALQIGQVWMNVLQLPPGQSSLVMHPKPALEPPSQLPVSQAPEAGQSASLQHGASAGSGLRHRPVSFTQLPPPAHATVVPQPPPPVQFAPGVDPPEQRIGMRSPVRKMPELSGRFRPVVLPALQSAVPAALAVAVLMTHVLVAAPACEVLGIGSGGPKRQPAFVHFVWAHFALLQAPEAQDVAPGEQSAVVAHVDAQSALVRHVVPSFEDNPWMQRLFGGDPPAASLALVPLRLSVVPLMHAAFVIELP